MVAVASVLLAAVAGCAEPADDGWECSANRCEVTVTGSPTLEVLDVRLKARVSRGRVQVSGGGVNVTLAPGQAAVVDGVRVEVRSIDEGAARLVVTD